MRYRGRKNDTHDNYVNSRTQPRPYTLHPTIPNTTQHENSTPGFPKSSQSSFDHLSTGAPWICSLSTLPARFRATTSSSPGPASATKVGKNCVG